MAAAIDAAALQALPGVPCLDKCVPDGMKWAVVILLAARRAGVSTDPAVLIANARCYECIPGNMRMSVIVNLARQIAGQ